jgi:hypothetical protein
LAKRAKCNRLAAFAESARPSGVNLPTVALARRGPRSPCLSAG